MRDSSRTVMIGLHEVEFLPPRTVRISWVGDVSAQEAHHVASFIYEHVGRGRRSNYVTDVSRLGKMPEAAAEALISQHPPEEAGPFARRLAFAGANVRTQRIMSALLADAKTTSQDSIHTRFFGAVDDAIAWALDDVTDVALSSVASDPAHR